MPLNDGVWEYTETETVSPTWSEHLNKLGDSIRQKLATSTSAWVTVPGTAEWESAFAVCVVRGLVITRGDFTAKATTTLTSGTWYNLGTIPAGFRPTNNLRVEAASSNTAGTFICDVAAATGLVRVRVTSATFTAGPSTIISPNPRPWPAS